MGVAAYSGRLPSYSGHLPPYSGRLPLYLGRLPPYPRPISPAHQYKISLWCCFLARCRQQLHILTAVVAAAGTHTLSTQRAEGIRTITCAAGKVCFVPVCTPHRRDGHGCRGRCGGRLHGHCEDDLDCDNPMQHVWYDYLAAKRSSKGKARQSSPGRENVRSQTRAVLGWGHRRTQSLEQTIPMSLRLCSTMPQT